MVQWSADGQTLFAGYTDNLIWWVCVYLMCADGWCDLIVFLFYLCRVYDVEPGAISHGNQQAYMYRCTSYIASTQRHFLLLSVMCWVRQWIYCELCNYYYNGVAIDTDEPVAATATQLLLTPRPVVGRARFLLYSDTDSRGWDRLNSLHYVIRLRHNT